MSTKIQWCDVVDNIIVVEGGGWWCRKISEGCANCYAAALNQSAFFGGNKLPYRGAVPKLRLREDVIDGWARQTKSKRHFVASMTDVFGEWVPQGWIDRFLDGMAAAPRQTFQILTKRAAWMEAAVRHWLWWTDRTEVPQNIWLGVSVENQKCADHRIPCLLRIPARVRFLSVEPLLGPVEFSDVTNRSDAVEQLGKQALNGIHWVIAGGESGPNSRPCHVEWIRNIVQQCLEAQVACFVKQLGSQPLTSSPGDTPIHAMLKHPKGGDLNEFPDDLKVREFPV